MTDMGPAPTTFVPSSDWKQARIHELEAENAELRRRLAEMPAHDPTVEEDDEELILAPEAPR